MRTHIIIFALTLILGVLYFALDRHLFYYGRNDFGFYRSLPLKVKPVFRYDFEGSFALEDEFGFRIISTGECQYVHSDIKLDVKNIIKYGYTKDTLIAFIENVDGKKYYINCFKNINSAIKQDMIINISDERVFNYPEKLEWVEIEKNIKYARKVEILRNYTRFVFITLFLVLIIRIVRSPKRQV